MNLLELKQQHAFAFSKAERIAKAAEERKLTEAEESDFNMAMAAVQSLKEKIKRSERLNTLHRVDPAKLMAPRGAVGKAHTPEGPIVLSDDYYNDFYTWIGSRGESVGAALYEGAGSAGGYAVPVIVDGQIVPLAPIEMGVRSIAKVVPTTSDVKIPRATSFSTAAAKAESGASDNSFAESDPTLDQFTLSAFMAGVTHTVSWEIAQDVPSFQTFCITDLVLAVQMYEENKYVNGSGTGEAQGLIGNTGAGVTGVLVGTDNYGSELLDATFDVLGTLKAAYHPGAGWLMDRATGVVIRKAQRAANLFQSVWTRENGRDYLHGYPVTYSGSMPGIAAGATPVLFGDFQQGYIIGDRGGSGINVKLLDQPKATEGQLILLGYRRTDGRVRRSEAIQAITLHA